jgi:HD-like signal output (HDOD) protein
MANSPPDLLDTLPPLPYVAHEILMAVNQSEPSMGDVAATLDKEPGLAARTVAMANSAFFAEQRPIYGVEEAIVRLGLNRVRMMAASLLLARQFDASRCRPFRSELYWQHAVGTAFAAARIARFTLGADDAPAAYLAGLLHNIGLLLLVHAFPKEMTVVLLEREREPGSSLSAGCRQALGVDPEKAGGLLLREWNLPEPIVAAVAGERGGDARQQRLARTVRVAAGWTRAGYAGRPDTSTLPQLPESRIEAIGRECGRELEGLAALGRLLASA